MQNSARINSERPDLRPAFAVTRLNTPSPRRSEGRCDQLGALSEPHRKQNLYANPKRTAKFSNNCSSDADARKRFKLFSKILRRLTINSYLINRLVTSEKARERKIIRRFFGVTRNRTIAVKNIYKMSFCLNSAFFCSDFLNRNQALCFFVDGSPLAEKPRCGSA